MTTERKAKQLKKRYERGVLNVSRKIVKAGKRQTALVELGKTLIITEKDGVTSYVLPPASSVSEPPSTPRLAWLGAKQYRQHGDSQKNRSGHNLEQAEALPEHASRLLAIEITKAMTPITPEDTTLKGITPESVIHDDNAPTA